MRIREATSTDIAAICVLGDEVNALHHAYSPELFAAAGDAQAHKAHWLTTLGKPDAAIYLAEVDGDVIGFVTMSIATELHSLMQPMRYARIGTVGVSAAHQGRGVGRTLMARAHEWAQHQHAAEVRLTVGAFNDGALRLYNDLGYSVRMHQLYKAL